jgi:hypothetical protein
VNVQLFSFVLHFKSKIPSRILFGNFFLFSALEEVNYITSRVLYFKLYSVDETIDNGTVSRLKIGTTKMIWTIQGDLN